jgi:hypothetical protein
MVICTTKSETLKKKCVGLIDIGHTSLILLKKKVLSWF